MTQIPICTVHSLLWALISLLCVASWLVPHFSYNLEDWNKNFYRHATLGNFVFLPLLLSMLGTYSDEFGNLDFERSQHGSGMSNRSTAKRFISALNNIAERTYNNLFQFHQLRQIAKELNIQV